MLARVGKWENNDGNNSYLRSFLSFPLFSDALPNLSMNFNRSDERYNGTTNSVNIAPAFPACVRGDG